MTSYYPSRPPRGRLTRVGVILDPRYPDDRLREVAMMCDHAGLDVLWLHDGLIGDASRIDAPARIDLLVANVRRAQVGIYLRVERGRGEDLATSLLPTARQLGSRLELSFVAGSDPEAAAVVRDRILDESPSPPAVSVSAEEIGYRDAARFADDVVLRAGDVAIERIRPSIVEACKDVGRDPATIGTALELPVSIGRTLAEAEARAYGEPLFQRVGDPAEVGIFGTLERCQQRVIELAHAGVTDLRCILPNNLDIHDEIAQLTAIAIGTVDVLVPGAPRSKDPEPPASWGGRRAESEPPP